MDHRIGAQLFTVRDYCKTVSDLDYTLERLAKIGYKVVQLSTIGDIPAKEVRRICDRYGMTVACTHRPYQDYLERMDEMVEYHKIVGTKVAGLGWLDVSLRTDRETLLKTIEQFNRFHEKLSEHGLRFAYHNHSFEFAKLDGRRMIDDMIEYGKFDFVFDTYWAAFSGADPAQMIERMGKRASIIHLKDLKMDLEKHQIITEVGQGNLNWERILSVCSQSEFALVEQDICPGDPFESLKISYDFLHGMGYE